METKKRLSSGFVYGAFVQVFMLSASLFYLINDVNTVIEALKFVFMLVFIAASSWIMGKVAKQEFTHRRNPSTTYN